MFICREIREKYTNYKLQITNSKILEKRNKKSNKNTINYDISLSISPNIFSEMEKMTSLGFF